MSKDFNRRLFVDMDGTLAVFKSVDKLETLYEKGYFANLEPIGNVVQAIKSIVQDNPKIDVYILSAYLSDSLYALDEKNAWLDQYLPEIPQSKRIFPPCGTDKKEYIPGGIRETDFLLDDYTHNLTLWQPPAKGIKLLNGINHTKETWQYDRIRYDKTPYELADNIIGIVSGKQVIRDGRPPPRKDKSIVDGQKKESSLSDRLVAAKEKTNTRGNEAPKVKNKDKGRDEPI